MGIKFASGGFLTTVQDMDAPAIRSPVCLYQALWISVPQRSRIF